MYWLTTTSEDFTDLRVAGLESMIWQMWDTYKKSQNQRAGAFIISPSDGIGPVSLDFCEWAEKHYNLVLKITRSAFPRILGIGFFNEEELTFFLLSGSYEHILLR